MRENSKSNKKVYIEVLRILAIFNVIYIHTAFDTYAIFLSDPRGTYQYWLHMVLSIISKSAVPMFFAITGAVLFNRTDEPISRIWFVRIPRILVCIVFFSAVYYLVKVQNGEQPLDLMNFLVVLYQGKAEIHLYYLYAHLSVLTLLPCSRIFVQSLGHKHFYYLYAVVFLTGVVITLLQFIFSRGNISIESHFTFSQIRTNFLFYPILGYFMEHRVSNRERRILLPILLILSIIVVGAVGYVTDLKISELSTPELAKAETYFGTTSFAIVPFIYLIIKELFSHGCSKIISTVLVNLGGCTMGVYLMHIFFMRLPAFASVMNFLRDSLNSHMLAGLLFCLLILMICQTISLIWKKIPVLRILIGG